MPEVAISTFDWLAGLRPGMEVDMPADMLGAEEGHRCIVLSVRVFRALGSPSTVEVEAYTEDPENVWYIASEEGLTLARRSSNRVGGAERVTLKVAIPSGTPGPKAVEWMKGVAEGAFRENNPPGAISVQAYTPGSNLDHAADIGVLELAPFGDWARANEAADGRLPRSKYGWRLIPMCEELEGVEVDGP